MPLRAGKRSTSRQSEAVLARCISDFPTVPVIPFQKPITVRSNCEPGTIRESSVGSDGKHCCGGEWPKRFISFPLKSCASQDAAASLSTAAFQEGRARCKSGGCRKITSYLKAEWQNVIFAAGTDEEYINQICDYNENAEHDDCPDSLASIIRKLWNKKETGESNYTLIFM